MASYLALRHPELFGNVIAQSASYWWAPQGTEGEWLAREVAAMPRVPVRFYMEVGLYEVDRRNGDAPAQLTPNRHFRDVLRAKGYDVQYREFSGGHDYFSWRGTLSEALLHFFSPQR
jgi:enterochelin esterase-like enzyme